MTQINEREKNLGMITLVVCALLIIYSIRSQTSKKVNFLKEQLSYNLEKIDKTKSLLASTEAQKPKETVENKAVPENRKMSLNLLRDLTVSGDLNNIKIVSTENSGTGGFKITIEAEFVEMMKFFSYLERNEGKFRIAQASVQRIGSAVGEGAAPSRMLVAVFQVGTRG